MSSTSRFEQHPSFVWEIRNFSQLQSLDSPDFFIENASYKLKLGYGNTPCDGKCIQIRLERLSGQPKKCYVCLDLSRQNLKRGYKSFRSFPRGFDKGTACVFLVPLSEWSKPDEELLPDGCTRIICTIDGLEIAVQDIDKRKAWFGTTSSMDILTRDFRNLLASGRQSDIVVKCGTKKMNAHSLVLFARSRTFGNMLQECKDGLLELDDSEEPVLGQLLAYIYSGNIGDATHVCLSKLCAAAAKYGLDDLKNKCFLAMRSNIGKDNVCDCLVVADELSNFELKNAAIEYLLEMEEEMLNNDEWREFTQEHSRLGNEVTRAAVDKKSKRSTLIRKMR